MAGSRSSSLPPVTQNGNHSSEQQPPTHNQYGGGNNQHQGNGTYHGDRGSGRGRGKRRGGGMRDGRAPNNNGHGGPGDYPHAVPYGGPYTGQQNLVAGGLPVLPVLGTQLGATGGFQPAPRAAHGQHLQLPLNHSGVSWQSYTSVPSFTSQQPGNISATSGPSAPPFPQVFTGVPVCEYYPGSTPMQATARVDTAGVPDSRNSSHGGNVASQRSTPMLHTPALQQGPPASHNSIAGHSDSVDPTRDVTGPPATLPAPKVPAETAQADDSSPSVAARSSMSSIVTNIHAEKEEPSNKAAVQNGGNKDQGSNDAKLQPSQALRDRNELEHIPNGEGSVKPLAALRAVYIKRSETVENRRSATYDTLKELLATENYHNTCLISSYNGAISNFERAVNEPVGGAKDNAMRGTFECMKKAKEHSDKSKGVAPRIRRCQERLEDLNRESVWHLETWYEGMHREMMKALGSAEKNVTEETEGQVLTEGNSKPDAVVADKKVADKTVADKIRELFDKDKESVEPVHTATKIELVIGDSESVEAVDGTTKPELVVEETESVKAIDVTTQPSKETDDTDSGKTTEREEDEDMVSTGSTDSVEGDAKDTPSTSSADTNTATTIQTDNPVIDPPKDIKDASAKDKAAVSNDQHSTQAGQQKKKWVHHRKGAKNKKGGNADSKSSSSTTLSELNNRPENKDNSNSRGAGGAKGKGQGQGQGQGQGRGLDQNWRSVQN